MPDERYRAVVRTQQFLLDLCNPSKTPRVPKRIREQACSLLRHYPSKFELDIAASDSPAVFESENTVDPVSKLLYDYESQLMLKNSEDD